MRHFCVSNVDVELFTEAGNTDLLNIIPKDLDSDQHHAGEEEEVRGWRGQGGDQEAQAREEEQERHQVGRGGVGQRRQDGGGKQMESEVVILEC